MIFLSLYVFLEVSHVEGSSLTTSLRYQALLSFLLSASLCKTSD
jgi:hypothetical protein